MIGFPAVHPRQRSSQTRARIALPASGRAQGGDLREPARSPVRIPRSTSFPTRITRPPSWNCRRNSPACWPKPTASKRNWRRAAKPAAGRRLEAAGREEIRLPELRRAIRQSAEVLRRMRQADGGGRHEARHASRCSCAVGAPMHAAVDGTVINGTTGKPQAGATVTLFQPTQQGPQFIDSVKTDAAGQVRASRRKCPPARRRPAAAAGRLRGVQYNKMLPPGTPTTGVEIPVYESSKKPGERQNRAAHDAARTRARAASCRSAKATSSRTTARPPGTIPITARCSSRCPPPRRARSK